MFLESFRRVSYTIYDRLPTIVKNAIFHELEPAYLLMKRALSAFGEIQLPVHLLKGKDAMGDNVRALVLADEKKVAYFASLLYSNEPSKKNLGKVLTWKLTSRRESMLPKADLTLIAVEGIYSHFLSRLGFIIVPQWVSSSLDISKPLSQIWKMDKNRSLKENLRKIRQNEYSYEISRDPSRFQQFYHEMYLPHIMRRFGQHALINQFDQLKRFFEIGHLILVKRNNDYVAGNIMVKYKEGISIHSSGVKQGNIDYLREGALVASYYFSIVWAKSQKYKSINFGHSRPFLNDGGLVHKKRWGMWVRRSHSNRAIFGIRLNNLSQSTKTFLARNPLIVIHRDKLKGLVFAGQENEVTAEELLSLFKTFHTPGLDSLIVISPKGFSQEAVGIANGKFSQKLCLADANLKKFCRNFPDSYF